MVQVLELKQAGSLSQREDSHPARESKVQSYIFPMGSIPFRRRIGIGAALSAISIGMQLTAFLVNNLLAHLLGAGPFAQYALVTTDFALFSILADFGIGATVLSLFAGRLNQPSTVWSVFLTKWVMGLFATIAMLGMAFGIRVEEGLATPVAVMSFGFLLSPTLVEWYFLGNRLWKELFRFKLIHALSYFAGGVTLFIVGFESITAVALMATLAPLPALIYGLSRLPFPRSLRLKETQKKIIPALLRRSAPIAISSLASFAYMPIMIYAMNSCWSDLNAKAAFTAAQKVILVLTGIVMQFFTSEQVHYDRFGSHRLSSKWRRVASYTLFSSLALLPFWLFAPEILRIFFFGLNWNGEMSAIAGKTGRLLSISILLQFVRLPALVQLMAQRQFWLSMAVVLTGGICNLLSLSWAVRHAPSEIALAGLAGDFVATTAMLFLFFRPKGNRSKGR